MTEIEQIHSLWDEVVSPKIRLYTNRLVDDQTIEEIQGLRRDGVTLRIATTQQVLSDGAALTKMCSENIPQIFPSSLIIVWYPHAPGMMVMVEKHRSGFSF